MTEEGRRSGGRGRPLLRGQGSRREGLGEDPSGHDCDERRNWLALLLDEARSVESLKRPLLAAALASDLRVLRDGRLGAPHDLFARVRAEEPRARHRRGGDDGQQGNQRGDASQHG